MLKSYLHINAGGFGYFYKYLGNRIFLLVFSGMVVAVLDGFGLAMFIPLVHLANAGSGSPANLPFITTLFNTFGLAFNITNVFLVLLLFFVLKGCIYFLHQFYIINLQLTLLRKLRVDALEGLNRLRYADFTLLNSGRVQNTITDEITRIIEAFHAYFICFSNVVMILAYLIFSFSVNFRFSLFIMAGGLLAYLCFRYLHKKTKKMSVRFTKASHDFQLLLLQQVNHFKYLKATSLMEKYSRKIRTRINLMQEITKRMATDNVLILSIREPLTILIIVVLLYLQVAVFRQLLSSMFLSLLLFYRAITAVMQFQGSWNRYLHMYGSIENYKQFIAELHEGEEPGGFISFTGLQKGIRLSNVHFNAGQRNIIRGISLSIGKNEMVALVGKSGGGKTTLVNLIGGLIPASKGRITIDEIDINELDLSTFRSKVGYISQDPVIFNDTLFNNVSCWSEKTPAHLERYREVMRQACLQSFTDEDILLGNNGINLSGGEKQRISIAREMFRDIGLLVIDEATSSLDSETETMIRDSITDLKGKLTIIIIAHRLTTIRNADRILIINNGTVEAEGSFEELRESSAAFQKMIQLQEL